MRLTSLGGGVGIGLSKIRGRGAKIGAGEGMGQSEGVVQRYKKDRYAALRNAKIRLSNIKLEEFTQVMRGKSKWIKH